MVTCLSYHKERGSTARARTVLTGARLPAVFSFAVTSALLFPPLPGRTGLLADLLPSFAVEIMPGIQSFNSLFAYFAVTPSVLRLHESLIAPSVYLYICQCMSVVFSRMN